MFTSCNKTIDKEETPELKTSQNPYNGKCGAESNMISSMEIPFDLDNDVAKTMMDVTASALVDGETYIRISKNTDAQVYRIQLMKYTTDYPAHKPTADKTIYEGTDAKNMAFAYYMGLLNIPCAPVEWFVFNGVYYVEDCC